ncbi:MAG TPA: hypothetical protein VNF68_04530 [Candidatus Baltobacteraceae bacterium]|nr:hypothetical protein [Candidatus Baltobacteraceae bacterium]
MPLMFLLVLAVVLGAPVQAPGSNITVTTCHAQMEPPPLRITYTNTAKIAATEVDFDIVDNAGTVRTVTDRGSFATGKPISHVFALPVDVSPLGLSSARCIVTKVVYADGTTWTAGASTGS